MEMTFRFPFGKNVVACRPEITESRGVYILGAYPSALHVYWQPPAPYSRITAIAVDNEPEVFWDGHNQDDFISQWKKDVHFQAEWGKIRNAGKLNGSSGEWVTKNVLNPLQLTKQQVWFSDCLDLYHCSVNLALRLEDTYDRWAGSNHIANACLPPHPSENEIVKKSLLQHQNRLLKELVLAKPDLVITLGNAALKVFSRFVQNEAIPVPEKLSSSRDHYGHRYNVKIIEGRKVTWLPLAHPAAPPAYQKTHANWAGKRKQNMQQII